MSNRRIVIVGAAQSGPTAAARARETDENATITVIERAKEMSYAVGGLVHHLSGEVDSLDALVEGAPYFQQHYALDVLTSTEVFSIDANAKLLNLGDRSLAYDSLIVATGCESVMPAALAEAASNVVRLRRPGDVQAIVKRIRQGAKRVAVIGGGFFGVEAADALRARRCQVTLIEQGPRLLSQFGEMAAHHATQALARRKVKVLTNAEVESVERRGKKVSALVLSDGSTLQTDLVVVVAGVRPRSGLLAAAGAAVRADGSVVVDRRCQTSLPDVYACGASVALEQASTGLPMWAAQASVIDKTAQVAGTCAAGGDAFMGPVVGSAVARVGDTVIARTGLREQDAFGTATVSAPNIDRFMPGVRDIHLELYYDVDGYVVGAEAAGGVGTDKRIDVLTAAILGGLSVEQLATIDLCYAAPFSRARDPINAAANVAIAARAGLATAWTPRSIAAGGSFVLVDVRGAKDFAAATLAGAHHLELSDLRGAKKQLTKLTGSGALVFLSDDGAQAYLASRIARAQGFASAGYLAGGVQGWIAAGYAVAAGGTSGAASRSGTRPAPRSGTRAASRAAAGAKQ